MTTQDSASNGPSIPPVCKVPWLGSTLRRALGQSARCAGERRRSGAAVLQHDRQRDTVPWAPDLRRR